MRLFLPFIHSVLTKLTFTYCFWLLWGDLTRSESGEMQEKVICVISWTTSNISLGNMGPCSAARAQQLTPLYLFHRLTLLGSLLERPGCSGLCFCFFFFFSFFFFFLSLSSSFFFFLCFFSCMSVPSAEPSWVGVSPGRYLLCLR